MPDHQDLTGALLHIPGVHAASHAPAGSDPLDAEYAETAHDHDADYAPISVTGTVTSVALTVPAELSVAGTPITGAGTLAVTKANQSANQLWAGPTSGAASSPAFRALVVADIPPAIAQVIYASTANQTAANTITATSLLAINTGTKNIASTFWAVGRSVRVKLSGYYKVSVGAPAGAAIVRVALSGTTLADLNISFPSDTGGVDEYWEIEAVLTCRVTGGSGSLMTQARAMLHFPGTDTPILAVPGQPMSAVTRSLTATTGVDVTWEWDTADADNTVTCTNGFIELL